MTKQIRKWQDRHQSPQAFLTIN